jgi:hypothetical protein
MFEKSFESIVINVADCLFIDISGVKIPVYIECIVILAEGEAVFFFILRVDYQLMMQLIDCLRLYLALYGLDLF